MPRGFWGHAGRPGQRGGSAPAGTASEHATAKSEHETKAKEHASRGEEHEASARTLDSFDKPKNRYGETKDLPPTQKHKLDADPKAKHALWSPEQRAASDAAIKRHTADIRASQDAFLKRSKRG